MTKFLQKITAKTAALKVRLKKDAKNLKLKGAGNLVSFDSNQKISFPALKDVTQAGWKVIGSEIDLGESRLGEPRLLARIAVKKNGLVAVILIDSVYGWRTLLNVCSGNKSNTASFKTDVPKSLVKVLETQVKKSVVDRSIGFIDGPDLQLVPKKAGLKEYLFESEGTGIYGHGSISAEQIQKLLAKFSIKATITPNKGTLKRTR